MVSKDTGPIGPEDPKSITVYAVTDDGLGIGVKGGESWENIHSAKKKGVISNNFSAMVISERGLFLSYPQGLVISTDNAKSWISVNYPAPLEKATINDVTSVGGQFVMATNLGIFISTNNASTFVEAKVQPGMVTKVVGQDTTYYAMNSNQVFISTNNAQSWSPVVLPARAKINDIDFNGKTLLIGTDQGLWLQTMGTPSFNILKDTGGLPENFIQAVKADDKNIIYAGTRQGLSLSKDLGKKWNTFSKTDGLESEQIQSITVFKGHFFLGTTTGVWISYQNGQKWDHFTKGTGLRSNNVVQILAK